MISRFAIIAAVFVVAGMIPPLIAFYVLKVRFIGGVWGAMMVGIVASFTGGLIRTLFLRDLPDLLQIGGVIDAGPPLILAVVFTVLHGLVSMSNSGS